MYPMHVIKFLSLSISLELVGILPVVESVEAIYSSTFGLVWFELCGFVVRKMQTVISY